jgi:hypothetical protein
MSSEPGKGASMDAVPASTSKTQQARFDEARTENNKNEWVDCFVGCGSCVSFQKDRASTTRDSLCFTQSSVSSPLIPPSLRCFASPQPAGTGIGERVSPLLIF